ncbi:hypothetical protein JC795_29030 [Pseudomonas veronii]|uniref:hypothetical protein n=1 Tax=Pseudomonas veronii TaxID=76761 RepID=UPI0018E83645|nr:hypothetical protein [Pseudomonas veronii]MBJ2182231.1 hypothetical protein [Pseudomonas veronii]
MTTIYEVADYQREVVHIVKGDRLFVEEGLLHIQDADMRDVAIFAQFDSVIAKPAEQE